MQLVVTGTHTDAGKTVVAAALTLGLAQTDARTQYWKPVQAGLLPHTDTQRVQALTGLPAQHFRPEAYCLRAPQSPHWAAASEGIQIDPKRLAWPVHAGPLVVEGAGGVLVPLRETLLFADQMAQWQRPVLLVARLYLGAINHTLLSLEALQARGVPLAGIVFSGDAYPAVEQAVAHFAPQVPIWGRFPQLPNLTPQALLAAYDAVLRAGVETIRLGEPVGD